MRFASLAVSLSVSLSVSLAGSLVACGGGGGTPPAPDAAGPGSDHVFDPTVVRTFELELAPADWQWLNDNALLEEYRPGALRYDGATYANLGIRFKGFFGNLRLCFDAQGRRTCKKLSLKLDFAEYDATGRFYAMKKINLHSMERDPSKLHDALGYRLFGDNGVHTARAAHARVVVNGELLGLFAVVEQIDGRFTDARFAGGGDGNLYKEVWPVHTVQQPYLDALQTGATPTADRMVRFATELAAASDAEFEAVLGRWMDLDYWARYLAVDRLIENWDGIVAWYCSGGPCFNHNYYWYEEPAADRVWPIPWDLDNAFDYPSPIRTAFGMPDWDLVPPPSCAPIPVFLGLQGRPPGCDKLIGKSAELLWARYAAASRELLAGDFAEAALQARIDALAALIADAVAEDPNGPTVAEWQAAVTDLRASVVGLRAYIAAKVQ